MTASPAGGGASRLSAVTGNLGSASPSVNAFLTLAELAARWRIHRSTVRRMIRKRDLAAIQIGSLLRVPLVEVQRYERRQAIGGGA